MIIVMESGSGPEALDKVCERVVELGYEVHKIIGVERTVVACVGHEDKSPLQSMEAMRGVEAVIPILKPYKLASREAYPAPSVVDVGGVQIGGPEIVVMAGPCSVESEEQMLATARAVRAEGAQILRGGAFKPRTSPYSFQGLKEDGLKMLRTASIETGMKIITELVSVQDLDVVCEYTDIIQIGARNVQNYALLRAAGGSGKAVMLKRGMATTVEEYLMAAEYLMAEGNPNVILCERGIRTFETSTRFTLDLNFVPVVKSLSHLPIIVDPSHGTGHWPYVSAMALAGIAAGADGLMIEVHPNPAVAASDGPQSLKPHRFTELMDRLRKLAPAVDRTLPEKAS